jgi:uncharacterized membrane protein
MDTRPLPNDPVVVAPVRHSVIRPVTLPGVVIGVGLGGFLDGIVLHQILRWHHMLSAVLPPTTMQNMEVNMVFDGYFHAGAWLITLVGVVLLWSAGRRGRLLPGGLAFAGQLVFGWGVFNLVEGLVDHQLLGVHHVRDDLGAPIGWDIGFLAFGALLIAAGLAMAKSGARVAH